MSIVAQPRRRGRTLLVLAAAASLGLAAGCSSAGDSGEAGDGAASEGYPITVEHAMGETTIESRPQTVVALDTSYVDAAVALELDVVGRITYRAVGEDIPDYLGEAGETYAGDATIVGTLEAPDLATIAELEPDLIVSAEVRHADIYDQLSAIAPTVFSESTGSSWKDNIRMLAEATGREELAEQRIGAYEERAAELGEAINERFDGEPPTISIVRFAGEPTVRLYSSASFPGIVQADVGLPRSPDAPDDTENIAVDLSEEQILDLDADHIFVSTWNDDTGAAEEQAERFTSNPLWDQLEGERHDVPDVTWFTSVSLQGAEAMLDDMAETFDVQTG
ncbi:ABC transporter substrate-binding protein [Marinitenerispora sediminis]|uniref:Iron-siderophore ABC transporter substrate-binding protein n=1 Tax=Marinitenerispora sediminis TaxID=1931232 RepID=A0A368T1X0_9ACTN|nr:iron-siderophore ABC transporter substrate-binding protein [Marinitenerispora sediminis]RCV55007.1 iron-siderophore ABC transporter substrate-binding protein [Marinitenerispora sediminis]RCV56280.1 iron-siderophore ABC transporter substrate-binding protein [Marinitenerispora sediminis]RCV61212.1 iron-siderophore ABC transporter substrate-binding protein [Marinitenerispora sediminis]